MLKFTILKHILPLLFLLIAVTFLPANIHGQNIKKNSLSGYIYDHSNGESLPGATVFVEGQNLGTAANVYGFFSMSLPPNNYQVTISFVGYADKSFKVNLFSDTTLTVELESATEKLDEVEITGKGANDNIKNTQMSVNTIDSKSIKQIPALLGEVDLVRALQMLPGVKFVAEGSSGMSVRGGGPDQNLLLLDEASVYNAGHLMGFFSVFNNDAVKSVTLYKGDLPAKFGGRLSSLIDVRMKDGNNKEFHGNGGIGLISSRLMLEGPIVKNKASFMVSGRRSYADLFLRLSSDEDINSNILYFYDLNMKVNYHINNNNHVFISGYLGRDVFKSDFFGMDWGNTTGTVRWNHIFGEKLFSNFTFVASRFNYKMGSSFQEQNSFEWRSDLTDYNLKGDFTWYVNPSNTVTFGFSSLYHNFFPGVIEGSGSEAFVERYAIEHQHALESGLYVSNDQKIGSLFTLKYGLRFSIFNNVGPGTVYDYDNEGVPMDSTVYKSGDLFNTYTGLEPRIGLVFHLNEVSSIKASYSRNYQYMQQAQNSTAGSPLNIWFPASPNVKPQQGDQYALGYFRNLKEGMFETSVEVYYKHINNAVDFKDHAELLLNRYLEGEIVSGTGYGYGLELMVRKTRGKLNGWTSYTYSRSFKQIDEISKDPYPAPYDRPHDFSIVINYQVKPRIYLAATWIYNTGNPVTFPTGRYIYANGVVPVYSNRNAYRMPDYHRLDLSFTYKAKQNPKRKWNTEYNVSLYNAYNRKNPWVINFQSDPNDPTITYAEMTYLFGIIPSFTFNFKF